MSTTEEKQEKIALEMAASASKGALVEKITFAGIPILFSCVVYLMNALSSANNEIIQIKSKIAVVVNADNKAIPPQGTTIDMAQIREQLNDKIDKVERDAALARAAMTLDREKSMSAIEKSRLDMAADAAQARSSIRYDMMKGLTELDKRISLIEKSK
jgi:Zn-dependent M32 family carboxypeptidase